MILNKLARSMAVATVLALGVGPTTTYASGLPELAAHASNRYFVIFDEPGALNFRDGQIRSPAELEGVPFDSTRSDVISYRAQLADARSAHVSRVAQALGRAVQPDHEYDVHFHGIVVSDLTGDEAARLAALPGVKEVSIVKNYELATDRVEEFIGAGAIFDGIATPDGDEYRGEGQVIAVIDTGMNAAYATHPAFQNDASCGHTPAAPKVIAKDCFTANCASGNPFSSGNPHGSHVASTAGGNSHAATGGDLSGTDISGVAPCARIVSYKVCATTSCDGGALSAAFQAIMDDQATLGITAANYSISGGGSPWSTNDSDRSFLNMVNAGIFVAASAGNTNDSIPNPIGQVNHRGPWVATVANSTHDRVSSNNVSMDQGGPQNMYGLKGQMTIPSDRTGTVADGQAQGNLLGCTAFTAGSMTGQIALIQRGDCNFSVKLANAQAAGAIGGIIYNANPGQPPLVMGETATSIPAVSMSWADGQAIRAHAASTPTSQLTISATTQILHDPSAGDILSSGSLRGPIAGGIEVTKPDITGPGSNIFAAYDAGASSYGFMSGTSMSGPHVAGAGALLQSVNPTWTPPEVKSALMLTAKKEGYKDFTNGTPNTGPWDADDVGNGRLDLTKAALSGLVMHETTSNFLAAGGNQANQRALNLPSMRNMACTPSCTFTRTVRNTLDTASSWTASGVTTPQLTVSVSPASFSFAAGDTAQTQTLTINVTPIGNQTAAVAFGEINLVEASDLSPDLHMTVAIRGQGAGGPPAIQVSPTSVSATAGSGSSTPVTRPLTITNAGGSDLVWNQGTLLVNMRGTPTVLWDQPVDGTNGIVSSFSTVDNGGAYTAADFSLTADAEITQIRTFGFNPTSATPPTIDWHIYPDAGGQPAGNPENNPGAAVWTFSTASAGPGVTVVNGGEVTLDLVAAGESLDLPQGTYWLTMFPTYNNAIGPAGSSRWNWYQSSQVAGPSLLMGGMFGVSAWTPTGAAGLGTAIEDVAFTLTGIQGAVACGAPWLSLNPVGGTVPSGQSQNVSVIMDPSGLADGAHNANVCIESNDPANPEVVVPVTFTVGGVGPGGDADLSLTAIDMPDPVGQGEELRFVVSVGNFGPDDATDVAVEFALPPELGFVTALTAGKALGTPNTQPRGGDDWSCADNMATVVCTFTGTMSAPGIAPALELVTTVSPSANPGTVSTDITVSAAQFDPVPGNNSVSVETTITGLSDVIFCDGFEMGGGCGPSQPPAYFEEYWDTYALGSNVNGQGGWEGWGGDPSAGALVTDVQAFSVPHAIDVSGGVDLVRQFPLTSGAWRLKAKQYIPSGFTGETYFILLNQFSPTCTPCNWSTQVNFSAGMLTNEGSSAGTLNYVTDQWADIEVTIDLDNNTQVFRYNNQLLYAGTWTEEVSGSGVAALAAIDLFANGASAVYYDDIVIEEVTP